MWRSVYGENLSLPKTHRLVVLPTKFFLPRTPAPKQMDAIRIQKTIRDNATEVSNFVSDIEKWEHESADDSNASSYVQTVCLVRCDLPPFFFQGSETLPHSHHISFMAGLHPLSLGLINYE